MKILTAFLILFYSFSLCAQTLTKQSNIQSKNFFSLSFGTLIAVGDVDIKGTNTPFINSLFPDKPENQVNENSSSGNYLGFSAIYGRNITPKMQVGIEADIDLYLNIGDYTRFCTPVSLYFKYKFSENKNSFFFYADPGFSPNFGGELHGGLKLSAGLGYGIKSKNTGHVYSISLGYSYQELQHLEQFIFKTPTANGETASIYDRSEFKTIIVNSLPFKFEYTF